MHALLLALLLMLAAAGQRPTQEQSTQGDVETRELLTRYLEEVDYSKRWQMEDLLSRRGEDALRAVQQRLTKETEAPRRGRLIYLLSRFRAHGVVRQLEAFVRREETVVCRHQAIYGLAIQGEKGVAALVRLLKSQREDNDLRAIASALCSTGDPQAADHVIRALKSSLRSDVADDLIVSIAVQDPELAVERFPQLFSGAPIPALAEMITALVPLVDALPRTRGESLLAKLRVTRPALLKGLRSADAGDSDQAARALGAMGDPATFAPIVTELEKSRREEYLLALARIDPKAGVQYFLRALDEMDPDGWGYNLRVALLGLGWSGEAEHAERIATYLTSESDYVVIAAADALAALGATDSAPAIAKALLEVESDRDEVPWVLVAALAALPSRDTIYPLARLVRDDERHLQLQAACALAGNRSAEATAELVRLADREGLPAEVRNLVVRNLASRSGPDVLEALLEAAGDVETRGEVLAGLGESEVAGELVPALIGILDTAGEIPPPEGEGGEEATESRLDPEEEERLEVACDLLGAIGDRRAVPALLAQLESCVDPPVAAVRAIRRLGDSRALELLLRLARCEGEDETFDEAARAVLAIAREVELDEERVDDVRVAYTRRASRLADRWAPSSTTAREAERVTGRVEALRSLELAAHPEGLAAVRAALRDESEASEVREAAARALAAIGPRGEDAESLLGLLERRGALRVLALEALLACSDPAIDAQVLRIGRRTDDPALAAGLAIYAIRCGAARPPKELNEALERAFLVFGGVDRNHLAEGKALGVWLTGGPWPYHDRSSPTHGRYSYYRTARIERTVRLVPPNWWLLRWVEEHGDLLEEDALFGKALREGEPQTYLARYPQGRYAARARERIAVRGE